MLKLVDKLRLYVNNKLLNSKTHSKKKPNKEIPPFYFIIVFWGAAYREYFLDLLLASLLSPNNIPALDNLEKCRFLICTTEEDWQAIQDAPIFLLMKKYIDPVFVKMDKPEPHEQKMNVMSRGHKRTSEIAFNDRAIGVFVTADLILSDGSVAAMQRLAYEGKTVVLCAAIRFEHHGCINEFKNLNALNSGQPLTLPSRQLMGIALRNLHSETIRYLWHTNHLAEIPVSCLWAAEGQEDYAIHTFSWAPLVLNYASLLEHDTKTFEEWTLDGDYVYKNFGEDKNIYIVTDSDEICLVSFTKEEDLHIPAVSNALQSDPILGSLAKMKNIHDLYHNPSIIDPLKRKLFVKTVYFHSNGISENLIRAGKRARRIVFWSIRSRFLKFLRRYQNYIDRHFQFGRYLKRKWAKSLKIGQESEARALNGKKKIRPNNRFFSNLRRFQFKRAKKCIIRSFYFLRKKSILISCEIDALLSHFRNFCLLKNRIKLKIKKVFNNCLFKIKNHIHTLKKETKTRKNTIAKKITSPLSHYIFAMIFALIFALRFFLKLIKFKTYKLYFLQLSFIKLQHSRLLWIARELKNKNYSLIINKIRFKLLKTFKLHKETNEPI